MKKLVVVIALIALMLFAAACGGNEAGPQNTGGVIGSVNGAELYQDEFDYYFENNFLSYFFNYYDYLLASGVDLLDEESARDTLASMEQSSWNKVVEFALIREIATDYGVVAEDYYLKDLISYGSYTNVEWSMISPQLYQKLHEEMVAAVSVTDADIQAKYDEDPAAWDSRKTSHILLSFDTSDEEAKAAAYDQAMELIGQLNDGADFAELAQEHSTDGSAANGGVIDAYITANGQGVGGGNYFIEYTDAAFALAEVGDFTQEPVLSSAGYHIIKIDDIRSGLEDSKEIIGESLRTVSGDDVNARLTEMVEERRATATIVDNVPYKYFDPNAADEEAPAEGGEEEPAEGGEEEPAEGGEEEPAEGEGAE